MRLGTTGFPAPAGLSPRQALSHSIGRARELGVQVLNAPLPAGLDDGELARLRDELGDIELEPSCLVNYCSTGDEAKQVRAKVIAALENVKRLGGPRLRTMAQRTINRFTKHPPLDEQLDMIEANLREVVAVAAELGITMAMENHCDYRGCEIAELIRRIDSPRFGAALDTANAFTSFEDPMDAAEALAPYAYTTHIKDFRIEALGIPGKAPWIPVGCALGEGNVDVPAIVARLAREAPEPQTLPLVVEVNWPPEGQDAAELIVRSVRYLRERFLEYLDPAAAPPAAISH
ncbi:MAG: sugar phosphate isomerase/epimerase [Chloroflexi bacterium]|nr:sugar phosphate isomerase/epimerase [Chloroflexota bacterium]